MFGSPIAARFRLTASVQLACPGCEGGGQASCAPLLRATRIDDVFERARRGEVLPQKTTYFFPKLLTGLAFNPLSRDGA